MKFVFAFIVALLSVLVFVSADKPDRCNEEGGETGKCLAYFVNYYYDTQKNECVEFVYGGCGGSQNRFDSIAECEETCKTK